MKSKQAKTPPLSKTTKFLCFDLETNGLHGQAFAIGALIIDAENTIHDKFSARVKLTDAVDPWVKDNVLSVIEDMVVTHDSYESMREAFWEWFVAAQEKSDYVLVSNGYPVEYRFLLDCQEAALDERYWQHPFPIIDSTSLLLGLDVAKKDIPHSSRTFRQHHPFDDAHATALRAIEALKTTGRIT